MYDRSRYPMVLIPGIHGRNFVRQRVDDHRYLDREGDHLPLPHGWETLRAHKKDEDATLFWAYAPLALAKGLPTGTSDDEDLVGRIRGYRDRDGSKYVNIVDWYGNLHEVHVSNVMIAADNQHL